MTPFIQVETTAASQEEAEQIAEALVERRLAACVHVDGPIRSFYRWQGALEHSEEWICRAKTRRDRWDELAAAITALHSYDCPQLIALPIEKGSQAYLDWLAAETS